MVQRLSPEQRRLLQTLYYKQGNFVGQKRLFALAKQRCSDFSKRCKHSETRSGPRECSKRSESNKRSEPSKRSESSERIERNERDLGECGDGHLPQGPQSRQVLAWLKDQEVYQLTLRQRRVKDYRPIGHIATKVGRVFQMDYTDFQSFGRSKGILVAVDVLSKKMYTKATVRNTQKNVIRMIETQLPPTIKILMTDNGSEFTGGHIQAWLKARGIKHLRGKPSVPQSQGIVERANQTIKSMLFKYMQAYGTRDWPRILKQITNNYNETVHSVIMMRPNDVTDSNAVAVARLLRRKTPMFKEPKPYFNVGDTVRLKLPKDKDKFAKGYTQTFSSELYTITKVKLLHGVYTYKVEGKQGAYYRHDIQKIVKVETNPFLIQTDERRRRSSRSRSKRNLRLRPPVRRRRRSSVRKHRQRRPRKQSRKLPRKPPRKPPRKLPQKPLPRLFEIDKFIDENENQFKVLWKGYPKSKATWEPKQQLRADLGVTKFDILVQTLYDSKNTQ